MNRRAGLEPAHILFNEDGTPHATDYDDIYHSASGGMEQARHVFLGGNRIPQRWSGTTRFAILETGFGLGINFLATWQAWQNDPRHPGTLHYFAAEKHPPTAAQLEQAHACWPELAELSAALRKLWPEPLAGFHRLHFESDKLHLTLMLGDVRTLLPNVHGQFDAIYLDGFSPERNPDMWSADLMADIAWLAAPDATVASYTVARPVRDALTGAGFAVEKLPGFGSKRDMLAGRVSRPEASQPAHPPIPCHNSPRHATKPIVVIGAGIAGVTVAERLARRDQRIILIDSHPRIAQGATGNKLSALLPALAIDETRLARLNRAAFFYALQRLHTLSDAECGARWAECGVLQLPRSDELAERQARIVHEQQLPAGFVSLVDKAAATQLCGAPVTRGGWWVPHGGWVAPVSVCEALLASAGNAIDYRPNHNVTALNYLADEWQVWGSENANATGELCRASTVVLANSHGMLSYPQAAHLPLLSYRGQVTHLPATVGDPPNCVLCGDGYLTPVVDGQRCLGASFERSDAIDVRDVDHVSNLHRLASMLPDSEERFAPENLTGKAGLRPVSPDKLPLLGALPLPRDASTREAVKHLSTHEQWPRWPGLYVATGYGARGMVWSHLMAELLACQIVGEPLPVEADLVAAVDPARYPWRSSAAG